MPTPMDFPILSALIWTPGLHSKRAPATPPGTTESTSRVRGADGALPTINVELAVEAVQVSRRGYWVVTRRPYSTDPSRLYKFGRTVPPRRPIVHLGSLLLLQADCAADCVFFKQLPYGDVSIEQLAAPLGIYLSALRYPDGSARTHIASRRPYMVD